MATQLPTLPRITFTILEPISLVAGWVAPFVNTAYFVSNQLPTHALPFPPKDYPLRPHETILALQVSNCYLLLGLVGLFVLNTSTELKVIRAYLWALWLGDIGHVAVSVWCMGRTGTMEVWNWNAVIWGNIGATILLFTMRSLYFLGAFDHSNTTKARATDKARRSQRKVKQ